MNNAKMDAMTECVARAIARRRNKEMEFEPQLSEFLDDARVAIAAMQEPTEARQYVSDAGSLEEPGEHQAPLPRSQSPEIIPNPHVRPLRAIANAGQNDWNLLAGRAANEIERMTNRIVQLERELERLSCPKVFGRTN